MPDQERLRLLLEDNAHMDAPQMARHISRIFMSYQYQMLGARVWASGSGGRSNVGFARPVEPITIQTRPVPTSTGGLLAIPLLLQQVTAIETLRNHSSIAFELESSGVSIKDGEQSSVQDSWRVSVARSDWIEILKLAGFMDILLLEIPMPIEGVPTKLRSVQSSILEAQSHFIEGNYPECVATCRHVIQDLGNYWFNDEDWAAPGLEMLKGRSRTMTKGDRERALMAVIRNYTHLAHHSESEGGSRDFSRSEAQMVLQATAAIVSRVLQSE